MKLNYWQLNLLILFTLLSIWFLVSFGFGFLGMIINFAIALIVSNFYSKPPNEIYQMIDDIRKP